ncbi:MAG: glycosyl hydrolase [Solirubrobacteraceae bacterium]
MSALRLAAAAAAAAAVLAAPGSAAAAGCVRVGVYQDSPGTGLPRLQRAAGSGLDVLSTYLTAGRPLSPAIVAFVNARKLGLEVTWLPDRGRDGPSQPRYRLSRITRGSYDKSLRTLAATLRGVRGPVVLRPMPEPNTPWYAWSGLVNRNSPKAYVAAWKRIRRVVRRAGGAKIKLLWAPYARSIPDTPANGLRAYFPGRSQVDLVGASAYNFGALVPLAWVEPAALFTEAYAAITKLAPKPFWIAETGSTSRGGDRAAWLRAAARLKSTMPRLAGIVWFDVRDRSGDFRLTGRAVSAAWRGLQKRSCR